MNMQKDIEHAKQRLIKQYQAEGLRENFGQNEVWEIARQIWN
jgi:hypothetical protein